MKRRRKKLSQEVKLAAMILAWDRRGSPPWKGFPGTRVSYEQAKTMTARQICALVEYHHWPEEHVHDGPDEPWNLEPKFSDQHLEETKRQATERARERKVKRSRMRHRQRMAAKELALAFSVTRKAIADNVFKRRKFKWPKRPLRSRRRRWQNLVKP